MQPRRVASTSPGNTKCKFSHPTGDLLGENSKSGAEQSCILISPASESDSNVWELLP